MAAPSAVGAAASVDCLAFMAAVITAWCALRASTKSASEVKGDLGSPTGLMRWQRQYSPTRVIIFAQCSSLVLTQRVACGVTVARGRQQQHESLVWGGAT